MTGTGRSDLVELVVELKGETDKAWQVYDGAETAWIPKSQAELERSGKAWLLTCPAWLALEKGLI